MIKKKIIIEEIMKDTEKYVNLFLTLTDILDEDLNNRFKELTIQMGKEDKVITINHLYTNLILWQHVIDMKQEWIPEFYFDMDEEEISKNTLSSYFDGLVQFYIYENGKEFDTLSMSISTIIENLNNVISLKFNKIFANTINLHSLCMLANESKDFNDLIHYNIDEKLSFEEIESIAKQKTELLIDILREKENCFKDYVDFNNINQLPQLLFSIGPKPDTIGKVFPEPINTNYLMGLNKPSQYFIDSSGGRKSSIINASSVKDSGYMTRKLSLFNMNTLLSNEIEDCNTKGTLHLEVTEKRLKRLNKRIYVKDGELIQINSTKDTHLIGQTINLRSPITCCSEDSKICKTCYGGLSTINANIHIGLYATLLITEQLTQNLLSSKHFLKTISESITWSPEFLEYFLVEGNSINKNPSTNNFSIRVMKEDIITEAEEVEENVRATNKLYIIKPKCEPIEIISDKVLFFSDVLVELIKTGNVKTTEDYIEINMRKIELDEFIFFIQIENKELSASLNKIMKLIDSKDHLGLTTKEEIVGEFLDLLDESKFQANSIHIDCIIRELLRDPDDLTSRPDFSEGETDYQVLKVSEAIINSPSIIISLAFENIKKQILSPSTYKKESPSFLDAIFQ